VKSSQGNEVSKYQTPAILAQGNEVSRDFDSDEDDTNRIKSFIFS
jgi:hypothetical protein